MTVLVGMPASWKAVVTPCVVYKLRNSPLRSWPSPSMRPPPTNSLSPGSAPFIGPVMSMGDQHAALGGTKFPDVMAELMTSAPEMGRGVPGWHAWLLLHVCMQLNCASPPAGYAALQKAGQLLVHVPLAGSKVSMAPGGQAKPVTAAAGEEAAMVRLLFFPRVVNRPGYCMRDIKYMPAAPCIFMGRQPKQNTQGGTRHAGRRHLLCSS
jgi:hypothetical protein